MKAVISIADPQQCTLSGEVPSDGSEVEVLSRTPDVEEVAVCNGASSGDIEKGVRVFSTDRSSVYRFEPPDQCLCRHLDRLQLPVSETVYRDGTLLLTIYFESRSKLKAAVSKLREVEDDVSVKRIVMDDGASEGDAITTADLSELTERQIEIVRSASENGYFDEPRGVSTAELADEFGLAPSTVSQHLRRGVGKIMSQVFESE